MKVMLVCALILLWANINAQNTFPATGNVGIGTTTPQTKLHVVGTQVFLQNSGEARYHLYNNGGQAEWLIGQKAQTLSNFTLSQKIGASELDYINIVPSGRFHISGPELLYVLNTQGMVIGKEWGGTGNLTVQGNLTVNSGITLGASQVIAGNGRMHISGPELLFVLNNQGMTISKAWGGTGNLSVEGSVLASRVKVAVFGGANWNWADYVFADDYKLKPIEEVEQFIKQNKHLPGIPSAAEMEKEGNDLGKTDVRLLEKIEELTLYIINLNRKVDKLELENGEMKDKLKTLPSPVTK